MSDKIFKRNITYGGPPKRIKERRPGANAKATWVLYLNPVPINRRIGFFFFVSLWLSPATDFTFGVLLRCKRGSIYTLMRSTRGKKINKKIIKLLK